MDREEEEEDTDNEYETEEEEESEEYEEEEEEFVEEEEYEIEEVDELEELTLPLVSIWVDPATGDKVHGILVFDDDITNPKNKCQLNDCSVCFQPMTWDGKHRICALPCGHLYGLSCIKKWLLQSSPSGKCPQCKTSCSSTDVILLFSSSPCFAAHQKASPTRQFSLTKQGYHEYKHYESCRKVDALKMEANDKEHLAIVLKQRVYTADQGKIIARSRDKLLAYAEILEESADLIPEALRVEGLERAAHLRKLADQWKLHIDAVERRADAMERCAGALERRIDTLGRRADAFQSRLNFFCQMYKEYHNILPQ